MKKCTSGSFLAIQANIKGVLLCLRSGSDASHPALTNKFKYRILKYKIIKNGKIIIIVLVLNW